MRVRKLVARSLAGALGLLLALSLVLVPVAALASMPEMGHIFWGHVTIGGEPVAEGTTIIASVPGGPDYSTETEAEGIFGVLVEPDGTETPEKDGADEGDLIVFYIDGAPAELYDVEAGEPCDSYPFEIRGLTELDLSVPDTTPPTVVITIADPVNLVNVGAVAVTITSDEDGTYNYIISDSTDEVTGTGDISAGVEVVLDPDLSSLADGPITADASVEDADENVGEAPPASATKDTVAPSVTIDAVTTPTAILTLTGTKEEGATVALTSDDTATFGEVTYPTDPTWSCEVTLVEGLNVITATATDATGNTATAEATIELAPDTTAPTVAIDSTASEPTNISPIPVTATFSEDVTGFIVGDISVGNGTADNFVEESGAVYTFDVTPADQGEVTVDIAADKATDAAGNGNEAATQFSITYDSLAPTVTIDAVSTPTNEDTQIVTGVMEQGATVALTSAEATFGDVTYDTTTWSCEVTLVEGSNVITATATDAAGNTDTAEATIVLDIVPPAVTIDPVTSPTNTATPTLTGDRHEGATVVLTSDEATFAAVTYPTDTTWSCDVTLVEGSNVITATADTTTATATIVLDTVAPTVIGVANEDGDTGVPVDTMEIAIFSEPMDELTITIDSFTLDGVSGTVSYDANTNTATFAPSADLDYDTTYTATLSTAITDDVGNPLAEYSWSFTTAKASLGDLIDEILAAGEDTLVLPAGTYSGDITIEEPITISGAEGTVIHGGITIGVLTGSEVIIENLTITDYIDYGIRIIKVRDVDDFTIRNNTIEGGEGSIIGIQVDEVEMGGTLDIWQNTISGNVVGILLLEDVAAGAIEFNNIVDNEVGLELQRVEHMVNARLNWWGDISGPEEGSENPGGTGDKIALPDGLSYYPWLTREFQTVLDDNIAYFGYPMVWLYPGWNIMSTPIALDPLVEWIDSEGTSRTGVNTWGDFKALGDGLDVHDESPAYSFDGETQAWVPLTSDSRLEPCDAIYVRMAEPDIAAILYSPNVSVPSKDLYSGWNLISLAWLDPEVWVMPADEALVTIEEVTGGLNGYKLVVSPNVNAWESPWIYIAGDPSPTPPDGWMTITSGYWVFMLNEGTLAGFTFTPISLPLW